jgi:hypothetical protein
MDKPSREFFSSSVYYLQPDQQDFPRSLVCIDGHLVSFSILSPAPHFSRQASSTRLVCVPLSIEGISDECFRNWALLSLLAFEVGCAISRLGDRAFSDCSLRSICIPISIQTIPRSCFRNCVSLSNVTFEPGSRLSNIGEWAFADCSSLLKICVPSSVESISRFYFSGCRHLSSLVFEPGSQISSLGESEFLKCSSLHSICLPARLRFITGRSLAGSSVKRVTVDSGNRDFRVSGHFLVGCEGRQLVWYCGNEPIVTISRDVEELEAVLCLKASNSFH